MISRNASYQINGFLPDIEILICTHNRRHLLQATLDSLNGAARPDICNIGILVVANACQDATAELLETYRQREQQENLISLRWMSEPQPGKSYALNSAIEVLQAPVIAFVDDDHRVDSQYLVGVYEASVEHQTTLMFCGRILPDWDGREPGWAQDPGPYAIYPLPVPRYEQGMEECEISSTGPLPGGGNLFIRKSVFDMVGGFSTELGPHGHDLGGGEDSDFVARALNAGATLFYMPDVVQYHYVEIDRFNLKYLLLKSYQRSFSVTRVRQDPSTKLPKYLWRKLFEYLWQIITSLYWPEIRFYLVRSAATLGEIRAYLNTTESK